MTASNSRILTTISKTHMAGLILTWQPQYSHGSLNTHMAASILTMISKTRMTGSILNPISKTHMAASNSLILTTISNSGPTILDHLRSMALSTEGRSSPE